MRVVLDSGLRLPLGVAPRAQRAATVPVWVIAGRGRADAARASRRWPRPASRSMRRRGAAPTAGWTSPRRWRCSPTRGITRLLVEGGPRVAAALVAADLVDEVVLFDAPRGRRGAGAVPALAGLPLGTLSASPTARTLSSAGARSATDDHALVARRP